MKTVSSNSIIDLYVWLDDNLARKVRTGRPSLLSESELLAILIQSALSENHQCLRSIYDWVGRQYPGWFVLPNYANFLAGTHRVLPLLIKLLKQILASQAPLCFADSTMIPVCRRVRAKSHRVAVGIAKWGRNHQDWFYGLKLHVSINHLNHLCAVVFTGANEHDNQVMERLVNEHTKVLVGDSHYGGSVQRRRLMRLFKTIVVAPPHSSQKRKLLTAVQLKLLKLRPKIEAVFGILKEKFRLVSSYPRSINGYFVHYFRILLGYQIATTMS